MSVRVLRTGRTSQVPSVPVAPSFQVLADLLQAAKDRIDSSRSGKFYVDILLLALVLVNATLARRSTPQSRSHENLARQAASLALYVDATMHQLIPDQVVDPTSITEREFKFITSLLPQLESMKEALTAAFDTLIGKEYPATTTSILGFHRTTSDHEDGISRKLSHSFQAFSLKISFYIDDYPARGDGVADSDGLILHWGQVALQDVHGLRIPPPRDLSPETNFWSNTYHAVIRGRKALVKAYSHASLEFRQDLEVMKSRRHGNLPPLLGWADQGNLNPFIAMSLESNIPFFTYLPLLCENSPELALAEAWQMLFNMRSTIQFIVTTGAVGTTNDLREILRTAVVDDSGRVILAPRASPEPQDYLSAGIIEGLLSAQDVEELFEVMYQDRGRHNSSMGVVDHIPRKLRPLRYALQGSPSAVLQTPPTRFGDVHGQLLALTRWRALPHENRSIQWPIPYVNVPYQVVPGDIGRFLYGANGSVSFKWLANAQREIGGYCILYSMKNVTSRISRTIWRTRLPNSIPSNPEVDLPEWYFFIPEELALEFLSVHAKEIGQRSGVSATELIFVTAASRCLRRPGIVFEVPEECTPSLEELPPERQEPGGSNAPIFLYTHFDDEGHVLQSYGSGLPTPIDVTSGPAPVIDNFDPSIIPFRAPKFVQLEADELVADKNSSHEASHFSIGDVGNFATGTDGVRQFFVVCNVARDLVDPELQPWERNDCENLSEGVWRSRPVSVATETQYAFSWSIKASLNLPKDLVQFYLYFLASNGGTKAVSETNYLQIVKSGYHQVRSRIVPQIGGLPLWLFVHFDEIGLPVRTYWSPYDQPSPNDPPSLAGCEAKISTVITKTPIESTVIRGQLGHDFRSVGSGRHSRPRQFSGQRIGDVGIWTRDQEGRPTDQWQNLGRVTFAPHVRTVDHYTEPGYTPCVQVLSNLWQSKISQVRYQDYSCSSPVLVHSRWFEALPYVSPQELSKQVHKLAVQNNVPYDDVLIVSRVTTDVHASAAAEVLKPEAGVRIDEYLTSDSDVSEDEDEDGLEDSALDVQSGSVTDEEYAASEDETSGGNRMPELCFYAALPLEGGCYGFWSRYKPGNINCRALARLDLEGWQRTGCNVRVSLNVERLPITHFSEGGPGLEVGLSQENSSEDEINSVRQLAPHKQSESRWE